MLSYAVLLNLLFIFYNNLLVKIPVNYEKMRTVKRRRKFLEEIDTCR